MGIYLKQEVLTPLHLYDDKNVIEIPFVTLKDPMVRYVLRERNKADMVISTEPELTKQIPVETPEPTELMVTEPRESTDPAPTEVNFNEITEEWFDDALFIGDSRTVGLRDYARLGKADYFCNVGMSVFGVLEARERDQYFEETDLVGLLRQKKYNKIYISLGLNDSGAPFDLLMDAYHTLLRTVREEQPQAVVILQAMITVDRKKASSEWYFAIDNLKMIDGAIRDFADGKQVLYIDANTHFADEEGYLPDGKAWDGCHFDIAGYQEWAQWILENAKTLNVSFG
jgi:hypothetical protein